MKKFLGVLVVIASILGGIFMIFTGKYMSWIGIINADFAKFWLAVGTSLLGCIVTIGGSAIGVTLVELGGIEKTLKQAKSMMNKLDE